MGPNLCFQDEHPSDRPGLQDSVRDGETGFLVPYGDDAAFAAKALEIIGDGELFARQSAAARAWAATFSWERCVDESLALFRDVARRGGRNV